MCLNMLHWFPIQQRICFKFGSILYKTLNSGQVFKVDPFPQIVQRHYLSLVIPRPRIVLSERAVFVFGT